MLDQDFIFQICKETINKFKNLNLEELDERLHDPMYSWIQNDPDKIKVKEIIKIVKNFSLQITKSKDLTHQIKTTKNIIFNEVLTATSLFPIILYPDPQDLSNMRYLPFTNLTENNLNNYLKYLILYDPIISKSGISQEKDFSNGALIAQTYSISFLTHIIFEECCLNLGVSNIKEVVQETRKNIINDIFKLIPKIKENGEINQSKINSLENIRSFLNIAFEANFLNK